MRYRSVFVYYKIVGADRVKKGDGTVAGLLLLVRTRATDRPTVGEVVPTFY